MEITAAPAPDSNGLIWITTCTYSRPTINANAPASPSDPVSGGGGAPTPAPITPQKIEWGFWTKTSVVWKDRLGDVIRNSAEDVYDSQPTREDEYDLITVTRTQSSFSPSWKNYLNNKINAGSFTVGGYSYPTHTLKCNVSATFPVGSNNNLWEVKIVLKYDPDGWDWTILNAGHRYKDAGTGKLRKCIDGEGKPATRPMLLDAAGLQLAPGGTPTYKTFVKYDSADFDYLGLGY
jgi:hypothetical protein